MTKELHIGEYIVFLRKYKNGSLAVQVTRGVNPYCSLSINTDVKMEENEFVLNHDCHNSTLKGLRNQLLNSGYFVETYKTAQYGYVESPIWRYIPNPAASY